MSASSLTDMEATVLRAVHAQEGANLYELAQGVGAGPRTVQEAVQTLAQHDFVHVSERGVQVRCTRAGDQWIRRHQ